MASSKRSVVINSDNVKRVKRNDEIMKAEKANTDEVEDIICSEYEVRLDGQIYVNIDTLFKHSAFKTYFTRFKYPKQFVKQEQIQFIVVSNKNVLKQRLQTKTTPYCSKYDTRLVKKDDRIVRLLERMKEQSYPLAPPVIKNEDLAFFIDKSGTRYCVEMRGERTKNDIYFKAKDIGVVFQSNFFINTIQRQRTAYREGIHYMWFTVKSTPNQEHHNSDFAQENRDNVLNFLSKKSDSPNQEHHNSDFAQEIGETSDNFLSKKSDTSNQEHSCRQQYLRRSYGNAKEMFLTFTGLMYAVQSTRSIVANEFRDWVNDQVFAITYGTVEQKTKMISTLCRVDKAFLQAFMKLVPNDLACVYLVDTMKRENGKRVLKFGRSQKIKERFSKHTMTFGDGTILDTVILVPTDSLSEAEKRLNDSIHKNDRFTFNEARELILLDADSYKVVRSIMKMIAENYNGSMAIHSSRHEKELDDLKHKYENKFKDNTHTYEITIKGLEGAIEMLKQQMEKEKSNIEKHFADEKSQMKMEILNIEKQFADEKAQMKMEMSNILSNMEKQFADEKAQMRMELIQEKANVKNLQETMSLRLENAELKAAQMINIKIKRIEELEITLTRASEELNVKEQRIQSLEWELKTGRSPVP